MSVDVRMCVVEWLMKINKLFKMKRQVLFLAVNVLDKYLEKEKVERDEL